MYIDYVGYVEDELISDEIEKVLERFELEEHKKEIIRQIVEALDDFFHGSCD